MAIRDHKRPSCGIGTAGFAIVRAANAVFDPQLSSQIDTAKQVTAPRQAFLPTRQLFLPRIDSRFLLPGRRSLPQLNCYPAAELRGGRGDGEATEYGNTPRAEGCDSRTVSGGRQSTGAKADPVRTRVTGYHRKHALRVLNRPPASPGPRPRARLDDAPVHQALTMLWEAADRICGQRLKALIPVLIDAMSATAISCLTR